MNILVLCHKIPYPPTDGGCIASMNMIQGLSKNGASITTLCMSTPKHSGSVDDIPLKYKEGICWNGVFVDTSINPIKALSNLLFSSKPYNAERFFSNDFTKKLIEILVSNKFDVIQLEGLYLAPYIDIIRKNSSAKIVMRSHNIEYLIWKRLVEEESNLLKKWYKNILQKRIRIMELNSLKKIDCLVPITKVDEIEFAKYYHGKCKVSSTGIVDDKFIERVDSQNANSLFYIGALDWEPNQKGLLWFFDVVWPDVQANFPQANFVLAGRKAPESFEKSISECNINYLGEVPDADVFMDENGIMVVPLFSGSGMRIKIVEAMARGKCIISTPIGAEGIPVENNKNIILAKDAIEMKMQIETLLNNPEKAAMIAENALAFAKKYYKNETITGDLLHFYNQILEK